MRIKLDLDLETTKWLVAIALAERRSAADQAQVMLEEVLGVRASTLSRIDVPAMLEAGLLEKG